MTLQQILDALAAVQAQLAAFQASQATFTQADIDAAVSAAVQPLNDQVTALQASIAGVPDQIHAAVVAEDAALAAKIKPLIDQLNAAVGA